MAKEKKLCNLSTTTEKIFIRSLLGLLIIIVLAVLCYEAIGVSIIRTAYDGQSIQVLNDAIKFQDKKPVEHYLELADTLFYNGLYVTLVALGFFSIVTHLVFLKKDLKLGWVILWGGFVLFGIYWLNSDVRIFSSHGLMHTNIVYEIMNGNIPPNNPLLGGEPLWWPWGHHFVTAGISKLFNISPSWTFAIINIISFIGIAVLVFSLSRCLIKEQKANVFSVIVAVFCSTWLARKELYLLRTNWNIDIENRAVPLFDKLLNINGVPIGLLFYLFLAYMLLKIFSDFKIWQILLPLVIISVAGVGFFYVQMLPGLMGSFAVFFAVTLFQYLRNRDKEKLLKLILTSTMVALGLLIVMPYVLSLTANVESKIVIFSPMFMWQDLRSILSLSLPLLIIFLIYHKSFKKLDRQPAIIMVALLTGVILSYVCVRLPSSNDYKFLIQAMVLLGIFGGICISFMSEKKRILVILIMILLARPFWDTMMYQLNRKYLASAPGEIATRLVTTGEEAELYDWILHNTLRDDIFIDNKLRVPYLGQRQIFIGTNEYRDGEQVRIPGYHLDMNRLFIDTSGYDHELLEYRWRIVRKIYDPQIKMDDKELSELFFGDSNLLIVVRKQEIQKKFSTEEFDAVFRSTNNNFAVFRHN